MKNEKTEGQTERQTEGQNVKQHRLLHEPRRNRLKLSSYLLPSAACQAPAIVNACSLSNL